MRPAVAHLARRADVDGPGAASKKGRGLAARSSMQIWRVSVRPRPERIAFGGPGRTTNGGTMRIAIFAGSNLGWPALSGPVQLTAFWSARLAIVAGLALAAVSPSLAQTAPPPIAQAVPPARGGHVYH